MAINTRDKRSSAIHVGLPWRGLLPLPDGSINAGDRQHAAGMYRGIPAALPPTTAAHIGAYRWDTPLGLAYCEFAWQTDESGSGEVSRWFGRRRGEPVPIIRGILERLETFPSADVAPTANYDVELLDELGSDLLQGLGANRSATVPQAVTIYQEAESAWAAHVAITCPVRLRITNAGDGKAGTVVLVLRTGPGRLPAVEPASRNPCA